MVKPLFCCSEYSVDDRGFVLSKRGKPLKPSTNHSGYQIVNILVNGKRIGIAVHTAVARAFCDGYSSDLQVNHKDGDKKNNAASNLEWVSAKENTQHAIHTLGYNNKGANNVNSKEVIGYDLNTGVTYYHFESVSEAGKYFSPDDEKRARHIQNAICCVAGGYGRKKSYRDLGWSYINGV